MKIERMRIHFLGDVFAALAFLGSYAGDGNTPASFPGSRDRDLLGGSGKEEGEGRKIWLGIFVVCNFSYVEIVNTLFIV